MNAITEADAFQRRFPVTGMTCASCVRRVESAIRAAPGVIDASVNLATESADVALSPGADPAPVIAAIQRAGYDVPAETLQIDIDGMTCASCVGRVEKALSATPGVVSAAVNLATGRATVQARAGAVDQTALAEAIRKAGYEPRAVAADRAADSADRDAARAADMAHLRRDLIIAAALTVPVFLIEMGGHAIPALHHWLAGSFGQQNLHIISFVLTTLTLFGPGLRFFSKGVPALLRLAPDMNSLVAIGAAAAWGYSSVATFLPQALPEGSAHVYFEAAAVIVTLILLGRFLEARARGRTSDAIRHLMNLQPQVAHVQRDGVFVETPLEAVTAGDVLQARPGDRIAVDGVVLSGASHVDESMISGEPVPVAKTEGSEVIGGTINQAGAFTYRAERVGADTVLAQIIRMVETAQGAKLPIQGLVDRITMWFVPAVMAVAAITFGVWLVFGPQPALSFALVNAVAVLIIACPCAMGLATPTSIMVGTGRAAELGVLFRNGEALQSLGDAKVIALDKTGTLTVGKPALTDLDVAPGFDRAEVLALVAAVEAQSEHPVATAIVTAAHEQGLTLANASDFSTDVGMGVKARVSGRDVAIGAARYMAQLGVAVTALEADAARLGAEAKTPLYAAVDGRLAAIIAVADPVRPTTPRAIQAMHALGLKVAMITGDNRRTAEAIAAQLGIDDVVAEVLPDGKVAALNRLREAHGAVAFVGDGINDAPALAEADVGVAIGTGSDVAIESADVALMSGDLNGVTNAIALSRATMRNIRQNLFWAFGYNAALIPVAAGVLYPATGLLLSPMLGAGAMALSSVFVLGNALRLRKFNP